MFGSLFKRQTNIDSIALTFNNNKHLYINYSTVFEMMYIWLSPKSQFSTPRNMVNEVLSRQNKFRCSFPIDGLGYEELM